jgi:hypothetical protein
MEENIFALNSNNKEDQKVPRIDTSKMVIGEGKLTEDDFKELDKMSREFDMSYAKSWSTSKDYVVFH